MNSRRIASALVALSTVTLLAGCGATGNDSPTRNIRQVTDGREFESGDIKVRNLQLVLAADGSASLVGTIVNVGSSADAITAIAINGSPVKLSTPMLALDKNKPVIFGGPSANATGDAAGSFVAGTHADVSIAFGSATAISGSILVKNA